VVALEGEGELVEVERHEAGEGDGEVEAHRHVTPAIVGEVEDLLVRLPPSLAEQHLGVFEGRGIDGDEPVRREEGLKLRDDRFFGNFRCGKGVPEPLQ